MSDARYYMLQGKLFRVTAAHGLFEGDTETLCELIGEDTYEYPIHDERQIARIVIQGTPVDERGEDLASLSGLHPLQAVLEQGVSEGWAEKLPADGAKAFGFKSDTG